ncbi:hypothetical protein GCM10023228_37260 [Brevibacillus fulvus]
MLHTQLDGEIIRCQLDQRFDAFYRGFAFEGIGLGLGIRSAVVWRGKSQFEQEMQRIAPEYVYQYYVGLGWWLHIRYGFRMAGYRKWLANLHPGYRPIVFDGVGFRTGLFLYRQNPRILEKWNGFVHDYRRVCFQGLGRSFWFLYQFDFARVAAEIERLPDRYRADTYSGVGLAIAYSMFDRMDFVCLVLKQVPDKDKAAFLQGLAFGWEARKLQNPMFWKEVVSRCTDSQCRMMLRGIETVHQVRSCFDQTDHDSFYPKWLDETRRRLQRMKG